MSKKKWMIAAVAVLVVAGGAYGLTKSKTADTASTEETTETMTLEAMTVEENLLLTGRVTAETEEILAELDGEIAEILVANGDWVEEGDLLMAIEPEDLSVSIAEAQASLESAKTDLEEARATGSQTVQNAFLQAESSYVQAKMDYEIQQQLYDLGTVSETAVETAKQDMLKAQSSYVTAKAEWAAYSAQEEIASLEAKVLRAEETLESLLDQADGAQVLAPVSGVVGELELDPGDDVSDGTTLLEITDTKHLTVEASVSEYDIGKLSVGQTIDVSPVSDDQDISTATITYIAPKGTVGNSDTTFEIEAVVDTKSDGLLANATVNLDILIAQAVDVLAVPYEALMGNSNRSMVLVQDGEEFVAVPVEQGVQGDLYVEIISSELSAGSVIQIPSTSVAAMSEEGGIFGNMGGGQRPGNGSGARRSGQ